MRGFAHVKLDSACILQDRFSRKAVFREALGPGARPQLGYSLAVQLGGREDLLHQRVVVAAEAPTHHVRPLRGRVVVALLQHEVHRWACMQVLIQGLEVIRHVGVLRGRERGRRDTA